MNPLSSIETELQAERASAVASSSEKLERLLEQLRRVDQDLDAAPAVQYADLTARRDELRRLASRQLWYVIVQREAVGLRDHEPVFRLYQIPPALRLYAGP